MQRRSLILNQKYYRNMIIIRDIIAYVTLGYYIPVISTLTSDLQWQLFISQVRLIKTYGHEGMRATFVLIGLCILLSLHSEL